jgi:hypothetical protein
MNMSSCGTRRILRTGLVVDAARAGFDAYLDEVDPPDPGSDPDELHECPLLAPARPTR